MKQKLFEQCGLLRITDRGKSRLYKMPKNAAAETFEIEPFPLLTEPQSLLEVYPEANLIVTQDALMTLDGTIILRNERDKISILPTAREWLIIQDSLHDNDTRYRLTFWDGKCDRDYIWGRLLLKSSKYFAVYTSGDRRWLAYTYDGQMVLDAEDADMAMKICGDFLVTENVGNYTSFSLKPQADCKADHHCVFKHQQLIFCSEEENFAVCANLQGVVRTYYDGVYNEYNKAEMVELYDKAHLFALKRNGRFFFYCFDGSAFAEDVYPYGADLVAYDEEENTLMVGVNGLFRWHNF